MEVVLVLTEQKTASKDANFNWYPAHVNELRLFHIKLQYLLQVNLSSTLRVGKVCIRLQVYRVSAVLATDNQQ